MIERKNDILKIIITALLFLAALICNYLFDIPKILCIILFVIPYILIGFDILKEAAEKVIKGELFDEDFLMSIATLGAFAIGEYPEAVFVMLFFKIGELFEDVADDRSRHSIESLLQLKSDTARIIIDGAEKTVSPDEVEPDTVISVYPGERIPIDSIVIEGNTETDNSALTGESLPVSVSPGDNVFGGCINLSGSVLCKTVNTYKNSTVSKILEAVENAAEKKSVQERFITRFSKFYTPIVCISAILIAVIPSLLFGEWTKWIYSALTFLVVSCPCALVISVPLAYFCGIGAASSNGILIKGADSLEMLAKTKTAVFDKTGTLTKGTFSVTDIHSVEISEKTLINIAALAEKNSNHPIAVSLKSCADLDHVDLNVSDISEIAGQGVSAIIEGKSVLVGNKKLMESFSVKYNECLNVGTVVYVAVDGIYAGHIVISDSLKKGTADCITELSKRGIVSVMLTGDSKATAQDVAEKLNINRYSSELLPEQKVEELEKIIDQSGNNDTVIFVGDGINDAPVLRRADVGIAMGALGSDAAIEAADVVIMDDSIKKIPVALKISNKTVKIVKQNIVFAISVKFLILILSVFSIPKIMWFAAFSDVGVMVIAVLNAIRALNNNKRG